FGVLSTSGIFNRKGYAGYEIATELDKWKYHVRHRVIDSELGRWLSRDPMGYVDGMGLYEYVKSNPMWGIDPQGLVTAIPCATDMIHTCDKIASEPCDCCRDAFRVPRNRGAIGVTVCCNGQLIVCINDELINVPALPSYVQDRLAACAASCE